MKKNLLVLIVVALILTGSYYLYINYHSPNQAVSTTDVTTSDWKTYVYKENNFSITHPADWRIGTGLDGELFIIFGTGESQKQLQVTVAPTGNRDLLSILSDNSYGPDYSNIKVNNIDGLKLDDGSIWLVRGDRYYVFYSTPKDDPTINQMIGSVQFN